jgi:hypothetical protein
LVHVLTDVAHRIDQHRDTAVALDHEMGGVTELGAAQGTNLDGHGDLPISQVFV